MLAAPSAPAAPAPSRPASHCAAGETVVYSCGFGRNLGSVCARPGTVHYRFGPPGLPKLDVGADAAWRNVRLGRVVGGGGGHEAHLRFSHAGHDYVVFEGVAGSLTETPGHRWSGVYVARGETSVAQLACKGRAALASGGLDAVTGFLPAALRRAGIEDTDTRFEMWLQ